MVAGSEVAVPDLLEEDWGSRVDLRPAPPPVRPAPRVPLEELSFWDLFPEDLPPSRRTGAFEETEWALEDQEDVLVGPQPQPPPPPPPAPTPFADPVPVPAPVPVPDAVPDAGAVPDATRAASDAVDMGEAVAPAPDPDADPDDNLLLTELLDLSPANTQAANAAHYGNLIEAGGGDLGGRYADDDQDDDQDDADADGDEADGETVRKASDGAGAKARSGSGSGSSGPGKRKPRPKAQRAPAAEAGRHSRRRPGLGRRRGRRGRRRPQRRWRVRQRRRRRQPRRLTPTRQVETGNPRPPLHG